MQKQLAFCLTALALGVSAVNTAHAQYFYPRVYQPGVPPHRVIAIVRSTGMTPVSRPIRRGPNYVVIASDRTGAQMRVVVDAFDGMIVRVRPVVAMAPYRAPYGAGVVDPYAPRPRVAIVPPEAQDPAVDYGVEPYPHRARVEGPVPPRNIPRVATAPTAAAPHALASRPPQTPLPRPRPALASNDATDTTGTTAEPTTPPSVKPVGQGSWPVPTKSAQSEAKSAAPAGELKLVPVAPLN